MRRRMFKQRWMISALAVILLTLVGSVPAAARTLVAGEPGVGGEEEATFRVVRSDLDGVVIEILAPAPVFQAVHGDAAHQQVEMAGFGRVLTGGAPRLPVKGLMVGVPPGAEISVRVVEMSEELVPGRYRVVAVPSLVADEPALLGGDVSEGDDLSGRWAVVEDAGIYGVDAFYPEEPVVLTDVGYIRHQRLARLEVYPLQANARSGEVMYHRRMVVEVRFAYPEGKERLQGMAVEEPDSFERMLGRTVVNYESARTWRDPAPVAGEFLDSGWEASLDPGYRIAVRETGLYEVTYAELGAAGLPTGVMTGTLQMYHHDQELAIHVEDENGDDVFGSGDHILFWGEAIEYPYAKYTADNIYWLTYGQAEGLRMGERDGAPNGEEVPQSFEERRHFEMSKYYWSPMPGDADDVDRWYWQGGFGGWQPLVHTIVVSDVVSTPVSPTIGTLFYGYTDYTDAPGADHHVEVVVNGDKVGDMWWDGIIASTAEFSITNLVSGTNEVRFNFPGDTVAGNSEITLLDWFEIGYDRAYRADGDQLQYRRAETGPCEFQVAGFSAMGVETYDVTDPYHVARVLGAQEVLSGTTYVVEFGADLAGPGEYWSGLPAKRMSPESIEQDTASDLRSTANGADYIMIAHGDFVVGTQALVDYYTTVKGWRVEVVDVRDVYDEFSGGVFYPGAIRAFLGYAFANWTPPAPSYVLLVGDGHYDYHRRLGSTNLEMYIPPYMAPVDFYEGERETDNRYVCFGGEQGEDACWPSMYIGRFPVNDTTELGTMVSRSVDYQASPAPGDWRMKTLFVSDDAEEGNNFYWYSDQIADYYLPQPYTAEKVYYNQVPEYDTAQEVRDAIVAAINEGRLLVSYVGHAADHWWAAEKLFRRDDEIPLLTNSEVWPIMLPMTCKEGRFAWYRSGLNGLSETLVRAQDKGAVASWAPSGLGVAVGHDYLEAGFFQAVFDHGIRRLGEATYEGKRNLWENGGGALGDLVETYYILGDPALQINTPNPRIYLPLVYRWYNPPRP